MITSNPTFDLQTQIPAQLFYFDDGVAIGVCLGNPNNVIIANAGSMLLDRLTGTPYIKATDNVASGWSAVSGGGGGTITGSGTAGKLSKFSSASVIADSLLAEAANVLTSTGSLIVSPTATGGVPLQINAPSGLSVEGFQYKDSSGNRRVVISNSGTFALVGFSAGAPSVSLSTDAKFYFDKNGGAINNLLMLSLAGAAFEIVARLNSNFDTLGNVPKLNSGFGFDESAITDDAGVVTITEPVNINVSVNQAQLHVKSGSTGTDTLKLDSPASFTADYIEALLSGTPGFRLTKDFNLSRVNDASGGNNNSFVLGKLSNLFGLWVGSATGTPATNNYFLLRDEANLINVVGVPASNYLNFRVANSNYGLLDPSGRWGFGYSELAALSAQAAIRTTADRGVLFLDTDRATTTDLVRLNQNTLRVWTVDQNGRHTMLPNALGYSLNVGEFGSTPVTSDGGFPAVLALNNVDASNFALLFSNNNAPTKTTFFLDDSGDFFVTTDFANNIITIFQKSGGFAVLGGTGLLASFFSVSNNYGQIFETADGVYSLGFGSVASAPGTPVLNWTDTGEVSIEGNLSLSNAGNKFAIKEGSNASMGVATLVAGTKVVTTTAVTANSRIFLTVQSPAGTLGSIIVSARTAGTSFTILSSSALDTSQVAWIIVEPAA